MCLYNKHNNTWLLGDMEFLFSCSIRYLTRSLRSLVRYRVEHSKGNSISPRAHVLLSIYSVRLVRATVADITRRCTTKVIYIVSIAVLHLDYSGPPTAGVTSVKAHCPVHLTICCTWVLAIQPTTPG